MSEMVEKFTGTMRILRPGDSLSNLGTMYPKNTDVIEQYVENGYDAKAKNILVVLEKNRIAIFDDGHGLVPRMTPDDYDTLKMYKEDLEAQKLSGDIPFEVLFPELETSPSLKSFQWMMECIGLSSKKIKPDSKARGIKGLGALSFQQIANQAVWHSKPSQELAKDYYKDPETYKKPPTMKLRSASASDIRRQILSYEITEDQPLKNPFLDKEATYGTLVELTELREGVERSLRPGNVVKSLQERFGNDIRTGDLKIKVLDRVTEDSEILIEVPPSTYVGKLIYEGRLHLPHGKGPFDVEIYYDTLGRNLFPTITRKGSGVAPITKLSDFNEHPWNIGKLNGLVGYPEMPDEEATWDSQKGLPLAGTVYNQWKNRVWGLAEGLEEKINEIEEAKKLNQLEQFSKILGREAVEAMRELPEFKDLVIGKTKQTTRKPAVKKINDRVIANVVNENNDRVSGAEIELWKTAVKELIKSGVTRKSGEVSFGQMPHGRYRLLLAGLPDGAKIDGMDHFTFNLSQNTPGVRETFHIINGEPKRHSPKPIDQLTPYFHDWENPDEPYIQRLALGVVEINTEGAQLREAILRNDEQMRAILCTQYIASAAAEYAAAEDEDKVDTLKNASRLFGVLLDRVLKKRR